MKRKLDRSLETKYEVLMEIKKGIRSIKETDLRPLRTEQKHLIYVAEESRRHQEHSPDW